MSFILIEIRHRLVFISVSIMAKFVIYSVLVLCFGMFAKFDHPGELAEPTVTIDLIEVSEDRTLVAEAENVEIKSGSYSDYLSLLKQAGPKEERSSRDNQAKSESSIIGNPEIKFDEIKTIDSTVVEVKENTTEAGAKAPLNLSKVDHSSFGTLLKEHVNSRGDVNYQAFKKDQAKLESYIESLSKNTIQKSWTNNENLAYYINVYNAYTIKLILDNYPLKSILDINYGKPWDLKFIKLGTTIYTLNNIENDIIRKEFDEPRIHFAVNCAASSCPPLLNDAYYAESLEEQLEGQTVSFINNATYNKISKSELRLSKIFDWYGNDFKGVKDFVVRYSDVNIQNAKITFKEYDWSLNKQ